MSNNLTIRTIHPYLKTAKITAREIEILACLLVERTDKKIAIILDVNPRTVETHIQNIMGKFNKHSREQIIDFVKANRCEPDLLAYHKHLYYLYQCREAVKKIVKAYAWENINCCIVCKNLDIKATLVQALQKIGIHCYERKKDIKKIHILTSNDHLIAEAISIQYNENHYLLLLDIVYQLHPQPLIDNAIKHLKQNHFPETSHLTYFSPHGLSADPASAPFRATRTLKNYQYFWGVMGLGIILIWCFFILSRVREPASNLTVPICSGLPIPANTNRINRPQFLKQISDMLKGKGGIKTAVIVGVGGIGKTILARQYARTQNLPVIWEVNADNPKTLLSSFECLAYAMTKTTEEKAELERIKHVEDASAYHTKLLLFVRQKLAMQKQWLLIFDNVDRFADIEPFFSNDPTWGDGQVIITTRNTHIKDNQNIQEHTIVLLTPLDRQEQALLFTKVMYSDKRLTVNEKRKLDHFLEEEVVPPYPLDTVIAAKHILTTRMDFEGYISNVKALGKAFKKSTRALQQKITTYDKTRYGIITHTVKNILEKYPEFDLLLLLMSAIGSQDIPKGLLILCTPPNTVDLFIEEMGHSSLLISQTDKSGSITLSMHRSTQQMIGSYLLELLSNEKQKQYFETMTQALEQYIMPALDCSDVSQIRRFYYHLHRVSFTLNKKPLLLQQQARIALLIGRMHLVLGAPVPAKKLLDISLEKLSNYYGDTPHPLLCQAMTYAGIANKCCANYQRAKALLEKSIKIYDTLPQPNRTELALALHQLGYIYRFTNEGDKIKSILERSIAIYASITTHKATTNLALAFSELASFYQDIRGNYAQAIHYRSKGLKLLEQLCGPHHPSTLYVKSWLAVDLRRAGRYRESLRTALESYKSYKAYCSHDIDHTCLTATTLGAAYRALGHYKEAAHYLLEGVKGYRAYFGGNHTFTHWAAMFLGQLYLTTGNYQEAKKVLENCLFGYQEKLKHRIEEISRFLGSVYSHLGNFSKAQENFEKSLDILEKKYGKAHTEYALTLKDFGQLFIFKGDYLKAEQLITCALKILKNAHHPEAYSCYEYLGDLYDKRSKQIKIKGKVRHKKLTDKARSLYKEALCIARTHLPKESAHIHRIKDKANQCSRWFSFKRCYTGLSCLK